MRQAKVASEVGVHTPLGEFEVSLTLLAALTSGLGLAPGYRSLKEDWSEDGLVQNDVYISGRTELLVHDDELSGFFFLNVLLILFILQVRRSPGGPAVAVSTS